VALSGPSGAGKTTACQVLLALLPPDRGAVRIISDNGAGGVVDLSDIDPDTWWAQIAWVPQRPVIVPGTVLANVMGPERASEIDDARLGRESPRLLAAARATGFDEVISALPRGWRTRIGQGGVGLSVGQRQRLSLTRALMSDAPLVVLDEPTAHLDAASEAHVLDGIGMLRSQHRTVVMIAHRRALMAVADEVIEVVPRPAPELVAGGRDLPETIAEEPLGAGAREEPAR